MNAHDAPHHPLEVTQPMTGKPSVSVYDPPPLPPAPPRAAVPTRLPQRARLQPSRRVFWLIGVGALLGMLLLAGVGVLLLAGALGRGVLPAVSMVGVRLGGMSLDQAQAVLARLAPELTLSDGERTWQVPAHALGLRIDAAASAARAYAEGRTEGDLLHALLGRVTLAPVVTFDIAAAEAYFLAERDTFRRAPLDAGVGFADGQAFVTPAQDGVELDIQATLARVFADPTAVLTSGSLALVTVPRPPAVTDTSAALAQARALLASPLEVRVFDPVSGAEQLWTVPPSQWGSWLTAVSDTTSPFGLRLQLDEGVLRAYLQAQANAAFDATRTLDVDATVASVQAALATGNPRGGFAQVKHLPRTHVVKAGESITSIAWDYGFPYPYLQQANNNIQSVSVGQTLVIPPADLFLTLPVVPHKRIVVSISQQRTRVYENGQLIQDWLSSTGIADSPTWTGVYQVISRVPNAYAGNWNLYMPYFIGVYRPIPNAEFTNGFHGFPTRGGGQILWENSLGRRVTYGCILLSNSNAKWLYDWAEEGVVVEILP